MSSPANDALSAARLLGPALRCLDEAGHAPERVLDEIGIDPDILADPDRLIPSSAKSALLERAAELTGDVDFGLRAGEFVRPGDYGLLEMLVGHAGTEGATDVVNEHHHLLGTDQNPPLEMRDDHTAYVLNDHGETATRVDVDYGLVCGLMVARLLLRRFDVLKEARFRHPRPADTREHERILAADLRFDAHENALIFPMLALPEMSDTIDPSYSRWLNEEAARRLAKMRRGTLTGDRVTRVLQAASGPGFGAESVAYQLAVSERTLRRQLAAEGTTFVEVRERVRSTEAARLLSTTDRSIIDIAIHLGFGDSSGFHRAFKRWTGTTPAAFRTQLGR